MNGCGGFTPRGGPGRSTRTAAIAFSIGSLAVLPATAASNFELTVQLDKTDFRVGDEVIAHFALTNVGDEAVDHGDFAGEENCDFSFDLSVTTADGAPLANPLRNEGFSISCLGTTIRLGPGDAARTSFPVNRRASLLTPGDYLVTGRYGEIQSPPVPLRLAPRSPEEMGQYIDGLIAQLKNAPSPKAPFQRVGEINRYRVLERLMYTGDARVLPIMVDAMYEGPTPARDALLYFLPDRAEAVRALIDTASRRGLALDMTVILRMLGAPVRDTYPAIERSLSQDSPGTWQEGMRAASSSGDGDRFLPRVLAIARSPSSSARLDALLYLTRFRSDEGVGVLRTALMDSDPQMRSFLVKGICSSIRRQSSASLGGRPLLASDFEPALCPP